MWLQTEDKRGFGKASKTSSFYANAAFIKKVAENGLLGPPSNPILSIMFANFFKFMHAAEARVKSTVGIVSGSFQILDR